MNWMIGKMTIRYFDNELVDKLANAPMNTNQQLLADLYAFLMKRDGFVTTPAQNIGKGRSTRQRQWLRSKKRRLSPGAVLVLCLEKSPKLALSIAEVVYLTNSHLSKDNLLFSVESSAFLEAADKLTKMKVILRLTQRGSDDLFALKKSLRFWP